MTDAGEGDSQNHGEWLIRFARDRHARLGLEGLVPLAFATAFTCFSAVAAAQVPYAILTGRTVTIGSTAVHGWDSVTPEAIAFQCVATAFLVAGLAIMRRLVRHLREEREMFATTLVREWWDSITSDHHAAMIIDGFGTSQHPRRVSVTATASESKPFGRAIPSLWASIELNGAHAAAATISSDEDCASAVVATSKPGETIVVRIEVVGRQSARTEGRWILSIRLLGDPQPPERLRGRWSLRLAQRA